MDRIVDTFPPTNLWNQCCPCKEQTGLLSSLQSSSSQPSWLVTIIIATDSKTATRIKDWFFSWHLLVANCLLSFNCFCSCALTVGRQVAQKVLTLFPPMVWTINLDFGCTKTQHLHTATTLLARDNISSSNCASTLSMLVVLHHSHFACHLPSSLTAKGWGDKIEFTVYVNTVQQIRQHVVYKYHSDTDISTTKTRMTLYDLSSFFVSRVWGGRGQRYSFVQ